MCPVAKGLIVLLAMQRAALSKRCVMFRNVCKSGYLRIPVTGGEAAH